jgi:hypothetical protein
VKFKAQVEYVLEFDEEDEDMNVAPRVIEFEAMGHGEEWSTMSGSAVKGEWQRIVNKFEPMQPIEEQPSGLLLQSLSGRI